MTGYLNVMGAYFNDLIRSYPISNVCSISIGAISTQDRAELSILRIVQVRLKSVLYSLTWLQCKPP